MKNQPSNQQSNQNPRTAEETIDAVYAMFGEHSQPLEYQHIGNFGLINPGPKEISHITPKLARKTRNLDQALTHMDDVQVIDAYLKNQIAIKHGPDADLARHPEYRNEAMADMYNILSDWSRFSIIIPDYASAPDVLDYFLTRFGGETIIHTKPDYYAIHLHTAYKDVNLEFQFHTPTHMQLKKATDFFYHKYNNLNFALEKNSLAADQYNAARDKLIEHCQTVYAHSDFIKNLFAVQGVVDRHKLRYLNGITAPAQFGNGKKLSNFCLYAKKAEMVQNELAEFLPSFLKQLDAMRTTNNTPKELN